MFLRMARHSLLPYWIQFDADELLLIRALQNQMEGTMTQANVIQANGGNGHRTIMHRGSLNLTLASSDFLSHQHFYQDIGVEKTTF